jgi:hypothetical protein
MNKTIKAVMVVLVVLCVVIGAQVSNADTVEKSGLRVSSPWPSIIKKALDTNPNTSTGVVVNSATPGMQFGSTAIQEGFVYNNSNFLKKIVVSLYALPDGTTASLLLANTLTGNLPGYETQTYFLLPHTWEKIYLRPARWTVREYNETKPEGKTLILSSQLIVPVVPGVVRVPPNLKENVQRNRNTLQEGQTKPATFDFCYPQG